MKTLFYPKLAVNGMKKNKRLYLPYILTLVAMVMMLYMALVFFVCLYLRI